MTSMTNFSLNRDAGQKGRKRGFVIGPLLVAVIVGAVLVGAFALTSQTSNTTSITETNRLIASTVIQQGATLRTGVERMMANGSAADEITFEVTGAIPATSLFGSGASGGGVTNPTAPANAFDQGASANATKWHFGRNVTIPNVGTSGAELVAILPDLKLGVCRYINNILFNTSITDSASNPFVTTGITDAVIANFRNTTSLTANTLSTAVDMTGLASVDGRFQGCIRTQDGTNRYVFFRILAESGS